MPSFGAVRRFFALLSVSAAFGLAGFTHVAPAVADEPPGDGPTKPASQVEKPAEAPKPVAKKRRGGINPCMTPDPGFGIYEPWNGSGMSMGQVLLPHQGGISKSGQFDVVIHFHGHEPIRKEFVKTAKGIVLVGIDLGIGSGAYQTAFSSPAAFTNLLSSIEAAVARHAGRPSAKIRKLALSSWSAGYGAIEQILRQPAGKKVDSLILLDSVHAGYTDEQAHALKTEQLVPFVEFAKRAAKKQTFMFLSHSSIIPPGYASTTEVGDYIVHQLGGKPKKANRQDVLGLDMIDRFDKGNFHMRGYTGDDKPDHCAHIGLMAGIVRNQLEPRWKSPKGRK
ncbi:hypothetical protein A7982_12124 [Minicystis rosea]|nr:hypothetical protein A7982_12124 [Minicystis rosea]